MALALLGLAGVAGAQMAPPTPTNFLAVDHPLDGGEMIDLSWDASDGDVTGYRVFRSLTDGEVEGMKAEAVTKGRTEAKAKATEAFLEARGTPGASIHDLSNEEKATLRGLRAAAADAAEEAAKLANDAMTGTQWKIMAPLPADVTTYTADKLDRDVPYTFKVEAFGPGGTSAAATSEPVAPTLQWLAGKRIWLGVIALMLCGAIVYWIAHARSGRPINVRKIAGLEAVDEAVGRATEMGRSCLFVPGIQDMNDIQTIAGITVLARVAKVAAEYDAKVEVPTARSLVMTTARETVQASFLAAGRPDAYNEDLIYYVTDEQFGYVAYLSGMMVREKPAACFYMGTFFAESLILAETGNSIGAIQVAGTAMPAQLPFFVAACDYTLIGEEFFAASAYLSGSAEELGSLKGQDFGKLIVAALLIVGTLAATFGLDGVVDFMKTTMLTG